MYDLFHDLLKYKNITVTIGGVHYGMSVEVCHCPWTEDNCINEPRYIKVSIRTTKAWIALHQERLEKLEAKIIPEWNRSKKYCDGIDELVATFNKVFGVSTITKADLPPMKFGGTKLYKWTEVEDQVWSNITIFILAKASTERIDELKSFLDLISTSDPDSFRRR